MRAMYRHLPACCAVLLAVGCHPPQAAVETRDLLDRGDLEAARRTIDRGVKAQPKNATLRRLAIRVRVAQNDRSGAVQTYRGWLDQRGKDLDMLQHLSLSVLRWGLAHRDPRVRLAAIHGARRTDADALETAVAERLNDPDSVVRSWAAVAMSRTRAGADVLEAQLRSPNPRARAVAVANLGRIAKEAALATLKRFAGDPEPEVRAALARGIAGLKQGSVLGLLERLAGDKDRAVRRDAIAALGRLGRPAVVKAVRRALSDSYVGVRLAAVLALAELRGDAAGPRLRELAEGADPTIALRAGVRLARLGEDQPVLNAIAKALVHRRWPIRVAACNAAASLGNKHPVARKLVAERALKDPEPRVRIAGARAVLALGDESDAARTAALLQGLACGSSEKMESICLQAAEVLLRSGNRAGLRVLERLTRQAKRPADRREALRIALTGGALLELAVDAIPDPDPTLAVAAATEIYVRVERLR